MKLAIYEPQPRICGPCTWAGQLRLGARELGHECDVVTFMKSGKPRKKWGRVLRENGADDSCVLAPDRCERLDLAGQTLDEYDLVIMTDIKVPLHDKTAMRLDELPEYVEVLSVTDTPFVASLHETKYYEEHEVPKGMTAVSGSPFVGELLALPNFCGKLLTPSLDFVQHCERVRRVTEGPVVTSPYRVRHSVDELVAIWREKRDNTVCLLSRSLPSKHWHVITEAAIEGMLNHWQVTLAGACNATLSPSYTFELYERLTEVGYGGDRRGGVCNTTSWRAAFGELASIFYYGAYADPMEGAKWSRVFVSLSDCKYSGGLNEFTVMESIDCACAPVITQPFWPHAGTELELTVIPRGFTGCSMKSLIEREDRMEILNDVVLAIHEADRASQSMDRAVSNLETLRREHDPRLVCQRLIEAAGL